MLSSLAKQIEALLFVATTPVSSEELACFTRRERGEVEGALQELSFHYSDGHGLVLCRVAEGWEICTAPDLAGIVSDFREIVSHQKVRLSRAAVECLAIVAYNQPVTRAEIEEIRGVRCERVLETLLSCGVIRIAGRRKGTGSPLLYRTTDAFLEHFGLSAISELPTLEEVEEFAPQKDEGE
ncbi:MAG TPA: SMC-Scp complex subunit ScpB [Aminobacterium sp.]|jgi:segregation and condensation protein B|uniref:SMC-Scp complex subunit ScpB n=1 Tax=Aminobacterium TaxID=81466 RepID=UPI000467AB7F|nr:MULTISPECIES: SMC-Scp complex subunit ScpB [Aminobacterium]HCA40898.1 SMC-Scp complex subunit ScpB [Aminobacterium sp.]